MSTVALRSLDRSNSGSSVSLKFAVDEALRHDPAVISVDVFDTVLIRPVIGEVAWFLSMCRLAGDSNEEATRFSVARSRTVGVEAPSLPEIYSQMPSSGVAQRSPDGEFRAELAQVRAVPGAAVELDRIRQGGVRVCFTSDTHFRGDQLQQLLDAAGLSKPHDAFVASSSVGVSKSAGGLFQRLPELVGSDARTIVHLGDNEWADGVQAKANNIRPVSVTRGRPSGVEAAMASDQAGNGPSIAAAARRARLESPFEARDQDLFELGSAVPGQCFVAFLLWVRNQCLEAGINEVAFLSRDGELPLLMAEALPADYFEGFELSYLHCSRRVWQIAAANAVGVDDWISVGTEKETSFIHHYAHVVPFRSLLHRIGLEIQDLDAWGDLRSLDPDAALPEDFAVRWQAVLGDPEIRRLIGQRAEAREDLVLQFLRQNRIGQRPLAIVDVGWRGQLAWMVSALVKDAGGVEPLHLHFGGDHVNDEGTPNANIRRFALDDSKMPHPIDQPVAAVEVFTGSGKARLVDYVEHPDGKIEELFDNPVSSIDSPERRTLWQGAVATAAAMPPLGMLQHSSSGHDPAVEGTRAVLAEFWNRPNDAQVRAASHLFVEADDGGHAVGSFIERYTLREIFGSRGGKRKWRVGSLHVTWRPFRDALKLYFVVRERGVPAGFDRRGDQQPS